MSNTTRNATMQAIIEGVVTNLMVKTTAERVFLDDTTTLAAKLTEMIEAINLRAKTTDVNTLVNNLRQEMLGDVPIEAYNTFTELAAYIAEHKDVSDALTEAIGKKANQATVDEILTTLNGLGALANKSAVSESDLDADLKTKVNAASAGNHSHTNKTVLDGITADKVVEWDSKSKIYVLESDDTIPENVTANDLLFILD